MIIKFFLNVIGIFLIFAGAAVSYNYFTRTVPLQEIAKEISTTISTSTPASTTPVARKPVVIEKKAIAPKTIASTAVATTEKPVITPGPLRTLNQTGSVSTLTAQGIINYTNFERNKNGGLDALTENELLKKDAQMKVDDMFAKQYFEHISPTGVGPSDLAKAVGYQYVVVGENLALGDFGGDEGVVTAWMNSPGHRANILNTHFQEIGVAAGKGMYEGRETWIAVQSFGVPLSACPQSDASLKAMIDANNARISILRAQIDAKKSQIESTPTNDPNYNTYVNEYNALLPEHNNLVESNRMLVDLYNTQVRAFNVCLSNLTAH